MSEHKETEYMKNLLHNKGGFELWRCVYCDHEILSIGHPGILRWNDGHTCRFKKIPFPDSPDH